MKKDFNIYFVGAIRGGRDDAVLFYHPMIEHLKKYGNILTEHVGDKNLSSIGEVKKDPKKIRKRDFEWIDKADWIVAEVTQPSYGGGIEIRESETQKKKILCLHRQQYPSALIMGSEEITEIKRYESIDQAKQFIDIFYQKYFMESE